jgi:ribosomal protein L13
MVDVLHASLLYWEQSNRKEISDLLEAFDYVSRNRFWKGAQAISGMLPEGEKENQMLQGFFVWTSERRKR